MKHMQHTIMLTDLHCLSWW